MQRATEPRSLLLGLCLGILLVVGFGAAQPQNEQPQVGRYQISSGGELSAAVVDTATGKVWIWGDPNFAAPKLKADK